MIATVVILADLIIPKDERSASASVAGAPEFVDHIVDVQKERQVAARGGLAWVDTESRRRFDKTFVQATDAQRRQILDDIAYPAKADKRFSHGVRVHETGVRGLRVGHRVRREHHVPMRIGESRHQDAPAAVDHRRRAAG